jgi:elongation factor Ts
LEVTTAMIKDLREQTGAGIMDCKRALEESEGDLKGAEEVLRQKGIASVANKAGRETRQGLVESYIHTGGRVGALVEVDCETDFVARTSDIKDLAHELAMQVAAMPSTSYVDRSEVDHDEARPPEEVCLLEQSYIRDPSRTVQELVVEVAAKVGENVKVKRFARFALGE